MKNLKKELINYLKSRGGYVEGDEVLVDELVFNINLANEAKEDIKVNGYQTNVTRNPNKDPYYQLNRSVNVYQIALKHINTLYSKLGLSPKDRIMLKLNEAVDIDDELDRILDERG